MNVDQIRNDAMVKMLKEQISNMAFAIAEQAGEIAVLKNRLDVQEKKADGSVSP